MFVTSPSWSIPGKCKKTSNADGAQKNEVTPSPCGYHPQKWQTMHSPSWKIGTSKRNKQNNDPVPGPGQYDTIKSNSQAKLGKFGHENYHKEHTLKSPSPNQYSPSLKLSRPASPSLTMSAKPKDLKKDAIPGPGSYESKFNTKSNRNGIKIGQQKRFVAVKAQGPGPQTYTPAKNNFKKVSVGFGKETIKFNSGHQKEHAKVPGPGSYVTKDVFENSLKDKKGFSISSKHKAAPEDEIPGPGQYDPVFVSLPQSPKVSMKGCHAPLKIENTPSPSQYQAQSIFNSKRNGYSIGKGERVFTDFCKNNPGPGAYDPKKMLSETPKFSLYGSRIQEQKNHSPGPGAYNPDKNLVKRRPQSAKIGNSKRTEMQKGNSPGPGYYDFKPRPSTPHSFGRQERNRNLDQRSPGPGDYNVQPLIGQAPYYSKKK